MLDFALKTDDILTHIADVLRPESIDDLTDTEFDAKE